MSKSGKKSASASILMWWNRLAHLPSGRWLFSKMLGRMAPYSGSIQARIEKIEAGHAEVSLQDRKKVRNHLNSIHAIALVNLGEISTGLAVLSAIGEDMRGILLEINAEYLKKARGRLTAIADFQIPEKFEDRSRHVVVATITDQAGETVTLVKATWQIGYTPK